MFSGVVVHLTPTGWQMPIRVNCEACGHAVNAPEKYAGLRVKCPGCKAGMLIPPMIDDGFDEIFSSSSSVASPAAVTQVDAAGPPREKRQHSPRKPRPVTIEKTSKKWKLLTLIGLATTFFGAPLFFVIAGLVAGPDSRSPGILAAGSLVLAFASAIGGVALVICARVMAWWHHG